jgi:hypothetical protein
MVASRRLRIPRHPHTLLHMLVIHSAGGLLGHAQLLGRRGWYAPSAQYVVSTGSLGLLVSWDSWLGARKVLRKYEADEGLAETGGLLSA